MYNIRVMWSHTTRQNHDFAVTLNISVKEHYEVDSLLFILIHTYRIKAEGSVQSC